MVGYQLSVAACTIYIPSVELSALWNLFLQSLSMKLDLPTAASPAKTSLYMRSGTFPSTTEVCNINKQTHKRYLLQLDLIYKPNARRLSYIRQEGIWGQSYLAVACGIATLDNRASRQVTILQATAG